MEKTSDGMGDHKNIYAAIAAATADVKRLAKDSRNVEQKYSFASIDDFLAMTGPICAAHGLVICMDEDDVVDFERQGKYGQTFWLRARFVLTVCHVSGDKLPPSRRTVEVIRTGAQSFGSAQSYALKQFLRALLQIPTGDNDDADFSDRGDGRPSGGAPARKVGAVDERINSEQLAEMQILIDRTNSDAVKLAKLIGVASFDAMTVPQWAEAMSKLKEKAVKQAEAAKADDHIPY